MKKRLLAAVLLCGLCAYTANVTAAPEEPALTFPLMSDIHVESNNPVSQKKFARALQDFNDISPNSDLMVINGDLSSGYTEDYQALQKIIESNPHPQLNITIGNHEFYKAWTTGDHQWAPDTFPNGDTEQAAINRFLTFVDRDSIYYDSWVKDYHFIFLGSEQYRQSDPNNLEDAYLSDTQLNWLKNRLAINAAPDKPIFVFLHQPLPFTVTGSDVERGVVQYKELKAILDKYPQVVFFTGHTHYLLGSPGTVVRNGFLMVNSSSEGEPWSFKTKSALDGYYSEGMLVQVYKDHIELRGRDLASRQWISYAQYSIPIPVPDGGR